MQDSFLFHRKGRPVKQRGCAASRAEQKLRFPENLDARVCEAHFLFMTIGLLAKPAIYCPVRVLYIWLHYTKISTICLL